MGPPASTRGERRCCKETGWRQHFEWDTAKVIRGVGVANPSGGREWAETGRAAPAWFRDFAPPGGARQDLSFRCVRDLRSSRKAPFPVYRDITWRLAKQRSQP